MDGDGDDEWPRIAKDTVVDTEDAGRFGLIGEFLDSEALVWDRRIGAMMPSVKLDVDEESHVIGVSESNLSDASEPVRARYHRVRAAIQAPASPIKTVQG